MEAGWVLVTGHGELEYWTGNLFPSERAPWSKDNLKAVRFSRQEDAEAIRYGLFRNNEKIRIEDHAWCP